MALAVLHPEVKGMKLRLVLWIHAFKFACTPQARFTIDGPVGKSVPSVNCEKLFNRDIKAQQSIL